MVRKHTCLPHSLLQNLAPRPRMQLSLKHLPSSPGAVLSLALPKLKRKTWLWSGVPFSPQDTNQLLLLVIAYSQDRAWLGSICGISSTSKYTSLIPLVQVLLALKGRATPVLPSVWLHPTICLCVLVVYTLPIGHQMSCFLTVPYSLETRSLTEPGAGDQQAPLVLPLPSTVLGLQTRTRPLPGFFVDVRDLNSGHHAYPLRYLSAQKFCFKFKGRPKSSYFCSCKTLGGGTRDMAQDLRIHVAAHNHL